MVSARTRWDTSAPFTIADLIQTEYQKSRSGKIADRLFSCLYRTSASPAEPKFCIEYAIYYKLLMDCDAQQAENRQGVGESGALKLYCAARCRGISRALSGFAAGRRLKQHSETALCLLLPVRRSAAVRFCPVGACARQHVVRTVRSGPNQAQILYRKYTVLQFVEYCPDLCKNKAPST